MFSYQPYHSIIFCAALARELEMPHCFLYLFHKIMFLFLLADFDLEAPSIKIRPFDNCTESEIVMIKVDSRSGKMMIMVNERIQGNK